MHDACEDYLTEQFMIITESSCASVSNIFLAQKTGHGARTRLQTALGQDLGAWLPKVSRPLMAP